MKKAWGRTLLSSLAAVIAGLLVVVGFSAPMAAAESGRYPLVRVVNAAGNPVSGVAVSLLEQGATYWDSPRGCGDHTCRDADALTDRNGYVYSNYGSLNTKHLYDLEVSYWDVPYTRDHIKNHPEWGSSPYSSITTDADGDAITVVLTTPALYGTVRDQVGRDVLGTYLAYEVTASGTQGRLAEVITTDGNDMHPWGNVGRFGFNGLIDGRKYKVYAKSVTGTPLAVSNQWVGGKDFASARTFVAGGPQVALTLQGTTGVVKNTTAPRLAGTSRVGSRMSVSRGAWSSGPTTFAYQWLRDGRKIAGATKSSYVLTSKDKGHRLRATVTAKRSGYASGTAQSKPSGKIGAGLIAVKKKPSIKGTQLAGRKLTVSKGSWSTSPSSFAYRWYRNGKAIKAATKSTYKLTTADRGKKISATVWAKKAGYATKSAKSGSRYIYKSGLKIGAVSVKGSRKVGKTVKAAVAKPSGVTVKYQWYRNGSAIKGATKSSYKLREDDWLEKVSVRVTYSRAGLPTVGKRSAKVYIPDNPYAYDEDDYYSDEDDYSGGSSGGSSSGGDPKCWAPGGKTQIPCP